MSDDARPRPDQLWRQADEEFPGDSAARRLRYVELMRKHGHLRPTLPGESRYLPCGWPGASPGYYGGDPE
jgi:hypothetical protein